MTILDADGNATVGEAAQAISHDRQVPAVVAPEVPAGTSAVPVVPNENGADKIVAPSHPANLPACGDFNPNEGVDDPATEDVDESVVAATFSAGTNTAGKCVIQVTAPNPAGKASDATRGTHTVTIGTASKRIPTVTVDIQVGGSPSTIESDAPERVDGLSETSIEVTVTDDEGVRVGATAIEVIAVTGPLTGTVTSLAPAMTNDGKAKFSFLAPSGTGTVSFLVRAGTLPNRVQHLVEIAVGPAPSDDPDAPPATWSKDLVAGNNLVVWNGDNDADPADGAAEGVVSIWSLTAAGWEGYFPTAADVPGGNNLDSLTNGEAYFVVVE